MFRAEMCLEAWSFTPEQDHAILSAMVMGFARVNRVILEANHGFPSLYGSGVRYIRDARGREVWRDCVSVYRNRGADCKSLCAWRAAELEIQRVPCQVEIIWGERDDSGLRTYHVRLRTARGIEDPSRILGMKDSYLR